MTTAQLREIEERALAANPGPWWWTVNKTSHIVELRGKGPCGCNTVLQPIRWGMQRASLQFIVNGLLVPCQELSEPIPGREHHADWAQQIVHPDAAFIAAARTDIPALIAHIREMQTEKRTTVKSLLSLIDFLDQVPNYSHLDNDDVRNLSHDLKAITKTLDQRLFAEEVTE